MPPFQGFGNRVTSFNDGLHPSLTYVTLSALKEGRLSFAGLYFSPVYVAPSVLGRSVINACYKCISRFISGLCIYNYQ